MTTRDTSSSSASSSLPSARTVTRHWMWAAPNDQADQFEVYKVTDIDPILAERAQEIEIIAELNIVLTARAEAAEADNARLKNEIKEVAR